MNILLNDPQRKSYKDVITELHQLCPQTIARKIPNANVQQAFVLDQVRKLSSKENELLCIGSHEDTACESLIKLGYNITAIDPIINISLDSFFKKSVNKFDLIFSTSVIEHVENDELFLDQICKLLKKGGYGILTCDFNNSYKIGISGKPYEDYRLYTQNDLLVRLNKILTLNDCNLFGNIDYKGIPDFKYGPYTYCFATYVFKKL